MTEWRDFTCYLCGRTHRTQTTQAEMDAEVVEVYGDPVPDGELESLCDRCYELAVTAARAKGLV